MVAAGVAPQVVCETALWRPSTKHGRALHPTWTQSLPGLQQETWRRLAAIGRAPPVVRRVVEGGR